MKQFLLIIIIGLLIEVVFYVIGFHIIHSIKFSMATGGKAFILSFYIAIFSMPSKEEVK